MNAFSKSAKLVGFFFFFFPYTLVHGDINVVVDVATENSAQTSVAGAINRLCPRLLPPYVATDADTEQLQLFCIARESALQNNQTEDLDAAYRQISALMTTSQTTLLMHGPQSLPVEVIDKRLDALRKAAQSATSARFQMDMNGQTLLTGLQNDTGGGASADPQSGSRWSGFATVLHTMTEQDETNTLAGFDGNTFGLVLGTDYRFTDTLFSGVALRYAQSDFDLTNNGGSLEADDLNLTLYGTYYPLNQWNLDWTLHYGQGQFDLNRRINFTLGTPPNQINVNEVANSSTDGSQYGISLGSGYEWIFKGGWLAQVNANFRYNQAKTDAYNETSAGGYNLHIEGQSIETMLGKLGVQGSKAFSFGWGVLIPQINLTYFHEFIDDGEDIKATFVSDPFNTQFVFNTEERDTSYFTTALGVVTLLPGGFTAYFQYEAYLGLDNYDQGIGSIGARMEF